MKWLPGGSYVDRYGIQGSFGPRTEPLKLRRWLLTIAGFDCFKVGDKAEN